MSDAVLGSAFTVAAARPPADTARAPAIPRPASAAGDLAPLSGRYYAEELDAPYEVRASGATLTVRRPRGEVDTLAVAGERTFRGGGLTYRFEPNVGGKSPGFAVDIGRARGMVFRRVE